MKVKKPTKREAWAGGLLAIGAGMGVAGTQLVTPSDAPGRACLQMVQSENVSEPVAEPIPEEAWSNLFCFKPLPDHRYRVDYQPTYEELRARTRAQVDADEGRPGAKPPEPIQPPADTSALNPEGTE